MSESASPQPVAATEQWFQLRIVDDQMNGLPDWEPRESHPEYQPKEEWVYYYDGQILGADVRAGSWQEAKDKADALVEAFLKER